jgi:3-oxoadipate enol-lactonase
MDSRDATRLRTAFEQIGEGSTLVLIHGLGMNRQMWQWLAPTLAEHFRVVSYDLIGHGESDKPAGPYAMPDFVDQIRDLADELEIDDFALVGFSLGGLIARAYALAYPEQVNALAILHSAHARSPDERATIRARVRLAKEHGPKATIQAALERWFTPEFSTRRPDVLQQIRDWLEANDPDAYAAAYDVLAESDADLVDAIRDIHCPTLVMTGAKDHGNSPQMAARMAARIPNAECRILPELRHMALAEDPESTLSQLLPFLAGTRTLGS